MNIYEALKGGERIAYPALKWSLSYNSEKDCFEVYDSTGSHVNSLNRIFFRPTDLLREDWEPVDAPKKMTLHAAILSGKPFANPQTIGAYLVVSGYLVHRAQVRDFADMDWIRENCLPVQNRMLGMDALTPFDLTRTDWYTVDPSQ